MVRLFATYFVVSPIMCKARPVFAGPKNDFLLPLAANDTEILFLHLRFEAIVSEDVGYSEL